MIDPTLIDNLSGFMFMLLKNAATLVNFAGFTFAGDRIGRGRTR
jgi:hypothetical protein